MVRSFQVLVGPHDADVAHPAMPEGIDSTLHLGWPLHLCGPLLGIEPKDAVRRVVVDREFNRSGIHQLLPDQVGSIDRAKPRQRFTLTDMVHNRNGQQIGL